jgi:pimeloyl-ACP methyl ester carboxylesterase
VVDDVLGDVQVYTTHDTNAAYYLIREAIVVVVLETLLDVLSAVDEDGAPLYHDIHVAGHSLGSTIALDTLIRARTLVEHGQIDESLWTRLRSLTTFGTALEKTRFLFDVRNPTVTAAQGQWEGDLYGRFFASEEEALPPGTQGIVRWRNLWYFRDIVANAISSYVSDVAPGEDPPPSGTARKNRLVCSDLPLESSAPFYAFVHGYYLGDPAFWRIVGPMLAR